MISYRPYGSYEFYKEHQASKINQPSILNWAIQDYAPRFRKELRGRIESEVVADDRVLCLGARLGTEVEAFIDLGCFAVGIDLNPKENNKFVVTGDFHHIQYADNSVDVVYCNAIDHSADLNMLISEIKRVLNYDGLLIIELPKGTQEGGSFGEFGCLTYDKINDVVDEFIANGFIEMGRKGYTYPDNGEQITLVNVKP